MEQPVTGGRVVLVGPTASGKSAAAMAAARRVADTEIVSIDAMAVYRGMDLGTAKPSQQDRAAVPHHLIDVLEPHVECTVAHFQQLARATLADLDVRGVPSVLVGGTGLYVRAVVDDLDVPGQWPVVRAELDAEPDTALLHERLRVADPVAAARMEPGNRRRIVRALEVTLGSGAPFSSFGPGLDAYPTARWPMLGMRLPRDVLDVRITERFRAQMDAGLLDEVRALAENPEGLSRTAAQALGYRELTAHLRGEASLEEAVETAIARIRRFARRQERWFRRDPRIEWLDVSDGDIAPVVQRLVDLLG